MRVPTSADDDPDTTEDALLRGRVRFFQPVSGYRSSLDPVLLASFVVPPFGRFVELGTGTGVLSFLLLYRDPETQGLGIEIQPRLAQLCARGIEANGVARRFALQVGDARVLSAALPAQSYDLVVTNPPYRKLGTATVSRDPERAIANHELHLALADWVGIAARILRPGGRLAAILPAARATELERVLRTVGIYITRARLVRSHPGRAPGRILVEARPGNTADAAFEPELVVHAPNGGFSDEVRAMLGG